MSGETERTVPTPGTGGVFLSYRRDETEHPAGRLGDRIERRFGPSRVFMDVDSIPPGVDFVKVIQRAVGSCEVMLAMIGPRWTTVVDDEGRRRLDDPEDFVVLELRTALARDIPVIPVLVDGARMPKKQELPPDLESFTRRNAVRLDAETFRQDSEALLGKLEGMLTAAATTAATIDPPVPAVDAQPGRWWRHETLTRRRLVRIAAGAAALGVAGVGARELSRLAGSGAGELLWSFSTDGEIYSSPEVTGGVVYVGSNDGRLHALDAATGRQVWRYATGGAVTSSPAVAGETVYVGSNDFRLHAVAASTGRARWTFRTGAALHSSPAVDAGVVYIGCRDHNLYAIDAATGKQRWRFTGKDWFNSSPVVANGMVYVGCRDKNVYAIDARTGEKRWSYRTGSSVDSSAAVSADTLWIGSDDHQVYALNATTGEWIWDFDGSRGGLVSTPLVTGGVLYVGSDDANLYAVDASTGRERWRHPTRTGIRSSPALADGVVYVGSRDRSLYAVDAETGEQRWSFATRGPIDDSSPTVVDGRVYVGSLDHRLYVLAT